MSSYFSESISQRRAFLIELSVWLAYFIVYSIVVSLANTHIYGILQLPFTLGLLALVFYTNIYVIVIPCVEHRAYVRLVIFTVLMLGAYVVARYLLLYRLLPWLSIRPLDAAISVTSFQFIADSIWLAFHYLSLSYGYYFALRMIRLERLKRENVQRILMLENLNRRAELAFLQAQLNPHFLFNTLNFFFADALKASSRLADGIMNLSQMLRSITETGQNDMVSAAREITYIRHYLNIQRYRFNEQFSVTFTVEGDEFSRDFLLPPLILISLVENVFKYGYTTDPEKPARIDLIINQTTLTFVSSNSRKEIPTYTQNGVGLSNIQKQLDIVFPGRATLTFYEINTIFQVNLSITST